MQIVNCTDNYRGRKSKNQDFLPLRVCIKERFCVRKISISVKCRNAGGGRHPEMIGKASQM